MLTEMMMIGVEVMMKMGTIMTKQMILINGHDRRQFAIEPSIKSFRSVQKILVVVLELVVDWLIDSIILVTIGTLDVLIDEVLRMFDVHGLHIYLFNKHFNNTQQNSNILGFIPYSTILYVGRTDLTASTTNKIRLVVIYKLVQIKSGWTADNHK